MAQKMMRRLPPGLEDGMEKMSPTEDLCIEHAQLTRIMLAIDHTLKAAGKSPKSSLRPVNQACEMIRQLVDEHHMKIEEDYIYPKFRDTELENFVNALKDQHVEARKMVARMTNLTKGGRPDMDELRSTFRDFKDMITAHAAYEESCLFPAVEGTWSDDQLDALREKQEEDEKRLLGEDATQKVFNRLTELESSCGIESVRDFTKRSK
jgi:hemerythrin-like domain-containing protein